MDPKHNGARLSAGSFRYSVVAAVKMRCLAGMNLSNAVEEVSKLQFPDRDGRLKKISSRSIYRWYGEFESGGFKAIESVIRKRSTSGVLSDNFIEFLELEKESDPGASVPEIIRRARFRGILSANQRISRTTVYRECVRKNLPLRMKKGVKYQDMRRFSYPHRMQMVLCDGKHFRAGASNAKRVALVFIDDATRLALHGIVGTSEHTEFFLRGLYEVINKHGFMVLLYLDNGPGFISRDTLEVVKSLDISLIHGRERYPEGHGKIERFNRTLNADLLRTFRGRPDVDDNCTSLEIRLQYYLTHVYNFRSHESLQGETPLNRFNSDEKSIILPESQSKLRACFTIQEIRTVSKDNIVIVDKVPYEMPAGYAKHALSLD
jgi:transposase InsO family protein